MTRPLPAAILAILIILAAAGAFIFSGVYDIGADTPHWAVTEGFVEIVRDRSIAFHANEIQIPDLKDEQLTLKGAGQYAAMCANCHLAPGKSDSEIRAGLYPKPPNLSEQRVDPKASFWVTKHGLKMSGMPAWGLTHDDATIWSIVAFVDKLPGLSAEHYKDLVAKAPPDEEMKSMDKAGDHPHQHQHEHGDGHDEQKSEPSKQGSQKSGSPH